MISMDANCNIAPLVINVQVREQPDLAEPFLRDPDPEQGHPGNGHLPQVKISVYLELLIFLLICEKNSKTEENEIQGYFL